MSLPPPSAATMELLLADAEAHRPVLETGLPNGAAEMAPKPAKTPRGVDGMSLDRPDADPNDLSLQRWGVIYADSEAGRRAFKAIHPLVTWRQRQQDATVKDWAVAAKMDLQAALDWKRNVLHDEDLAEAERPRYLLILGDLDEVSAELGHVLANGAFVGRIHFDSPEGYSTYAQKVIDWEQNPAKYKDADGRLTALDKPIVNFYVARDGTNATSQGLRHLVAPCIEMAKRKSRRPFPADVEGPWEDVEDVNDMLAHCRIERPSVLVSVCHGTGRPLRGWKTPEHRRMRQGAMSIGSGFGDDSLLSAEQIASGQPFLPGGMWFALTCFGAGTPEISAYHAWLRQLKDAGQYGEPVARVLESLPTNGETPFLAALPKAALENPMGPLAIIGHLDLAWTYSFADQNGTSRASRIFSALNVLANGSRAGVALDALMRAYREVNDELISGYQAEEDARVWNRPYAVDGPRRAHTFMLRNDLRGYVLLGDPAARLPLAGQAQTAQTVAIAENTAQPGTESKPQSNDASSASPRTQDMERAVLAVLAQNDTSREIAKRYGTTREELDRWVDFYKAAGRAALENINNWPSELHHNTHPTR